MVRARQDGTAEVIESRSGAPVGGGAVALGARPVGVHAYGPGAARADARLLVATAVGDVAVFTAPCEDANGDAAAAFGVPRVVEPWAPAIRWRAVGGANDKKRFDDADVDPADPGGGPCPALVARATRGGALLAMGGRGQGLDLNVHDAESQKVAFKAKPPPRIGSGTAPPPPGSPRWRSAAEKAAATIKVPATGGPSSWARGRNACVCTTREPISARSWTWRRARA